MGDIITELRKREWEVTSVADAYQLNEEKPSNSSRKDLELYYYNSKKPYSLLRLSYLKEPFSQMNLQEAPQ